jgi:hypothetical protein
MPYVDQPQWRVAFDGGVVQGEYMGAGERVHRLDAVPPCHGDGQFAAVPFHPGTVRDLIRLGGIARRQTFG